MNITCLIKKIITKLQLPDYLDEQQEAICLKNIEILINEYGFANSLNCKACVGREGFPIPWYTYPAIEYISQFDLKNKNIFEYGCGNSSLFYAGRAKNVVSVENNKEWYTTIHRKAPPNLNVIFREAEQEYVNCIDGSGLTFDLIVIDGAYRFATAEKAVQKINNNGLIILDNSDRAVAFDEYSKATMLLRSAGLIQADMSGFGPLNGYTWTTSFFFTKNFDFQTLDGIQPHQPIGGNVKPIGIRTQA